MRFYADNPYTPNAPSVTTILGVLNKPWLNMWYAKIERAYCADKMFDAHHGLLHIESPYDLLKYIEARFRFDNPDPKIHYQAQIESRDAMGLGSWLHNSTDAYYKVWLQSVLQELYVHATPETISLQNHEPYLFFLSDYYPSENIKMLAAYFQWLKEYNVTRLKGEFVCHSPEGYSGTADMLAMIDGVKYLIDFKTGDPERIGPPVVPRFEHRLQVEAYRRCPAAKFDGETTGRGILYFRKGKFAGKTCFWHEDLNLTNEEDWISFLAAKRLFNAMNKE